MTITKKDVILVSITGKKRTLFTITCTDNRTITDAELLVAVETYYKRMYRNVTARLEKVGTAFTDIVVNKDGEEVRLEWTFVTNVVVNTENHIWDIETLSMSSADFPLNRHYGVSSFTKVWKEKESDTEYSYYWGLSYDGGHKTKSYKYTKESFLLKDLQKFKEKCQQHLKDNPSADVEAMERRFFEE